MYKVIIAENEDTVRNALLKRIQWSDLDMHVIAAAPNGAAALQMIEKEIPDILITDIRMPQMDGLALCKVLYEKYPSIYVIILSGYDLFQYAQEAIRFGVKEYLLKPITPSKLTHALKECQHRLQEQKAQSQENTLMDDDYRLHIRETRRSLLACELCYGLITPEQALLQARQMGFSLQKKSYLIAAVYCSQQQESISHSLLTQIKNDLTTVADRQDDLLLCYVKRHKNALIYLAGSENADELTESIKGILNGIIQEKNVELIHPVSYKLSTCTDHLSGIFSRMQKLLYEMKDDKELQFPDTDLADQKMVLPDRNKLISFIKTGTVSQLESFMQEYLAPQILASLENAHYRNLFISDAELACIQISEQYNFGISEDWEYVFQNVRNNSKDAQEAILLFREIIQKTLSIRDNRTAGNKNKQDQIIQEAYSFMRENLSDRELNLQAVAKHVHLSANYFGIVFKQYAGMTFIHALTKMKIEQACILLRTTDKSIKEIASMTGYEDEQYFFKVFRKEMQITPAQYRIIK